MLNVSVSEIILNEPGVCALIRKREAATVAQHVRVGREREGGCFAANVKEKVHR